jgi:hypothetical protein
MDLRIVKRELLFGEESQRKGLYSVSDNVFRFWYRFVPDNVSSIEAGMGEVVFDKRVLPELPNYMGRVFEDVCKQCILRRNKAQNLPIWVSERAGDGYRQSPDRARRQPPARKTTPGGPDIRRPREHPRMAPIQHAGFKRVQTDEWARMWREK